MTYRIQYRGPASPEELRASDKIIVVISLGQAYHEGEQFRESMRFLKELGIKVKFVIADTLQVDTKKIFARDTPDEELKQACQQEAEAWKQRNAEALEGLGELNQGYIHWDAFLEDSAYEKCYAKVWELYHDLTTSEFKNTVESVVKRFAHNLNEKLKFQTLDSAPVETPFVEEKSRAYIMKECAVFLMWIFYPDRYGYSHVIYPAKWHAAFDYLYKKCVNPAFPCLKPIQLDIHEKIHTITEADLPQPVPVSLPLPSISSPVPLPNETLPRTQTVLRPRHPHPVGGIGSSQLRLSQSAPTPGGVPLLPTDQVCSSSSAPTSPRGGFFHPGVKSGHSSWPGPGMHASAEIKPESDSSTRSGDNALVGAAMPSRPALDPEALLKALFVAGPQIGDILMQLGLLLKSKGSSADIKECEDEPPSAHAKDDPPTPEHDGLLRPSSP